MKKYFSVKFMEKKRILKYCCLLVITFLYILIMSRILEHTKAMFMQNFNNKYFIIQFFAYSGLGVIIGLIDYSNVESKKPGKWKVNIEKIIFFGIPTSFLACANLFYYQVIPFSHILNEISWRTIYLSAFIPVIQFIFGYILVTSFYKEN